MLRRIYQLCIEILQKIFRRKAKKPKLYLFGRHPADVSGTAAIRQPKLALKASGDSYDAYRDGTGSAVYIPPLGSP